MKIYVDYDSTLNNMTYAWLEWINEKYNRNYTNEDVTHWEWYEDLDIDAFEWFNDGLAFNLINPLPNSQEFHNYLSNKYETHILTSSKAIMKEHKNIHIKEHYNTESVIHHHNKYEYATNEKSILIDDRPKNCIDWVEAGGTAFIFNHDNNYRYSDCDYKHRNLFRVNNYEEIKEVLNKL